MSSGSSRSSQSRVCSGSSSSSSSRCCLLSIESGQWTAQRLRGECNVITTTNQSILTLTTTAKLSLCTFTLPFSVTSFSAICCVTQHLFRQSIFLSSVSYTDHRYR